MSRVVDEYGHVSTVIDKIDKSRRRNSPQQSLNLKVEGGMLAIAFSMVALGGVVVGAILIPEIIEARANEAAAPANAKASYAERDSRVALDKIGYVQSTLDKAGLKVDENH